MSVHSASEQAVVAENGMITNAVLSLFIIPQIQITPTMIVPSVNENVRATRNEGPSNIPQSLNHPTFSLRHPARAVGEHRKQRPVPDADGCLGRPFVQCIKLRQRFVNALFVTLNTCLERVLVARRCFSPKRIGLAPPFA